MYRRCVSPFFVLAALVLCMRPAVAQQGVTELGFDMAFAYETESELFSISLPTGGSVSTLVGPPGGFRAGFFLGDSFSLEPTLSFQLVTGNGDSDVVLGTAVKFLYHFSTDPSRSRAFVAIGPSFVLFDDDVQAGALGEVGVKLPIASRIGARLAAGFNHGFETDNFFSRNIIYATAGLSVFLGGN